MITALFSFIASIPSLLSSLEKFVIWISEQIVIAKKNKLEDEMKKAEDLAKQKKDTSKMDDLFQGGK